METRDSMVAGLMEDIDHIRGPSGAFVLAKASG